MQSSDKNYPKAIFNIIYNVQKPFFSGVCGGHRKGTKQTTALGIN